MIADFLYSWEIIAFVSFLLLWKFSRSFLKIDEISGKHVFISGCDSGFGRALAERLDKRGVTVYAGCFFQNSVTALKNSCSPRMKPVVVDVTSTESVQNAADFVKKDLGNKALWAVVNNAGKAGIAAPFEWLKKEDCQQILDVNLLGVFDVTLAFLPLIKRGNEGRIVNIASIYGRIGWIVGGYAMSKHAIEAFSDGLSVELRPYNITVHTLEPGFFRTGLVDSVCPSIEKRWSEFDEQTKEKFGKDYCDKRCDSGFGRALAERLDKKGVTVYAGCFFQNSVTALKNSCSPRMKPVVVDVTSTESVQTLQILSKKIWEAKVTENNVHSLWAVVNNAGIAGTTVPFAWSKKEDCQQILDVNLLGVFDVTLAFLPLIKRGNEGRIVNIASIYGRIGWVVGGYAMSKHAIEAFSDGLSVELRPYNITSYIGTWIFSHRFGGKYSSKIEKRWSELDEQTKEKYGNDYCDKLCDHTKKFLNTVASPRLELVVDAYEHALFGKYPNNRYVVGNDAKFFFIPVSWLPFSYQMMVMEFVEHVKGTERPLPRDAMPS
uniref:LOW QUALITY PROTEIN: retinol dehydrogenase 7-like n=1 Tax=Styela clava TaxID=7725 RepID=UPI001939D808|nr:LOW QUALITY PROTEIN: retinol dehydrogenase 7-like [Styela clava]